MSSATAGTLDSEQRVVHSQLYRAVEQLNQADELLQKSPDNAITLNRATALALSAIAKVFVVSAAAEKGMLSRLPAFKQLT